MANIYVKWLLDPTKGFAFDNVPQRWRSQVDSILRNYVEVGRITKEEYKEITGNDY